MVIGSLEQALLIIPRDLAEVLHEMGRRVRIGGKLRAELLDLLRHIAHLASQRAADPLRQFVMIHLDRPEQRIGLAGVRRWLPQDRGDYAPLVFGSDRRVASMAEWKAHRSRFRNPPAATVI